MKKPWITKGIVKSIDKKNKIYRKCIRTKNATKKEKLYELFKTYGNSLSKITKLSKVNYYYQFFEENKRKLNKIWQGIKEIIDISKNNTQKIQNINDNGKLITSHKKIANTFNKFFCDIPKQIENKIVGTHKSYQDYLITPIENTFNLDPKSTGEEMQSYVKTLKNNKSTGPSNIPNKLFKQFKKPL